MTPTLSFSAATALQRQVENPALIGGIAEPAIRTDQITGKQPFQSRKKTEQNRLQGQPNDKGNAPPPQNINHQRDHKTPGFSDSDSLRRINHSSETVL